MINKLPECQFSDKMLEAEKPFVPYISRLPHQRHRQSNQNPSSWAVPTSIESKVFWESNESTLWSRCSKRDSVYRGACCVASTASSAVHLHLQSPSIGEFKLLLVGNRIIEKDWGSYHGWSVWAEETVKKVGNSCRKTHHFYALHVAREDMLCSADNQFRHTNDIHVLQLRHFRKHDNNFSQVANVDSY